MNIPITKQEEMFAVWIDNPSIKHVAKACKVSEGSVRKYKKVNAWEDRLTMIHELLKGEVEQSLVQVRKTAILELVALRMKAKTQALTRNFKDAGQAGTFFLKALEQELNLRGATSDTTVNVLIVAAGRFQERQNARATGKVVDIEPVSVEDITPDKGGPE